MSSGFIEGREYEVERTSRSSGIKIWASELFFSLKKSFPIFLDFCRIFLEFFGIFLVEENTKNWRVKLDSIRVIKSNGYD